MAEEKIKVEGASNQVVFNNFKCQDGSVRRLVAAVSGGQIIKRFDLTSYPGSPSDVFCPHFLELKWAHGCPFNCAWCYLQGTLRMVETKTAPVVKNMDNTLKHLNSFFMATQRGGYPEMLNSGEISDSLIVKDRGPAIWPIVEAFQKQSLHRLLILTKNTAVAKFRDARVKNVVFSFSINAESVARRWEKDAPSPLKRLDAAAVLADAGLPVRIRIDPIVPVPTWKDDYRKIVGEVYKRLDPQRITLGTLRGLSNTITHAHDKSWVEYLAEDSSWGKKAPFNTRLEIYKHLMVELNQYGMNDPALCKEQVEIFNRLGLNWKAMKCNCTY